MKKLLFIPVLLLILTACNDDHEVKPDMVPSDLTLEKMSGDIDSIEETPFSADSTGNIGEMDTCCFTIINFDSAGNRKIITKRKISGKIDEETFIERYINGMWKSSRTRKPDNGGGNITTTVNKRWQYTNGSEFDAEGKRINFYTGLTQNENGQILTWKRFDQDSVFREEGTSMYDSTSLLAEQVIKDSVGNIKSRTSYTYNAKGELIEETKTETIQGGSTTTITKYTYENHDERGNWTQRTTWDNLGRATKIVQRIYSYRG